MFNKRNTCYNIYQVFLFSVCMQTAGQAGIGEESMKRHFFRAAASLILGAALCLCMFFSPATAEMYYVENEWNYVDESMDADHGIPDNATGVMDRIKRKGGLRVATEPYFPPFEFIA